MRLSGERSGHSGNARAPAGSGRHDRRDASSGHVPRGSGSHRAGWHRLAACVGLVSLLGACGAAGPSVEGVASLHSPAAGLERVAGTSGPVTGSQYEQAIAYSQCMREQGITDFPDPQVQADGSVARRIEVQQGSDLDPNSSRFQAAYDTCRSFLPTTSPGQAQQVDQQRRTEALQYSACMRSHGVPDFPDPVFSNGGEHVTLDGQIDTSSPAFQSADAGCQSLLSGGPAGPTSSAGATPGGTGRP